MRASSSSFASSATTISPARAFIPRPRRRARAARARGRGASADPFADPAPVRARAPPRDWRAEILISRGRIARSFEGARMVVRAFAEDDVDDVAKLLLDSGMLGFPTERATLRAYLLGTIGAYPYGTYLVGVVEGEIVATVGVSFNAETRRSFSSLAPPSDEAYLSDLTVDVDARGRGLGSAMLRGAEDFARAMGANEMWLHVALKKPKVCAMYYDRGYGVAGVDPGLFGWRGRLLMRKKIE